MVAAPRLTASQRRLLKAYAAYAKVMTERRLAAAADLERLRLADTDRTRTALLAAVSHDLRSPLAAIRAAVDSLRSQRGRLVTGGRGGAARHRRRGHRPAHRAGRQPARHEPHPHRRRHRVGHRRRARRSGAQRPLPDRRLRAHRGRYRPRLVVRADPGLLDRVLANICDNALKYTPDNAAIRIDAARNNGRITLRIADSGPGLRNHRRGPPVRAVPALRRRTPIRTASGWDLPSPRASPRRWAAPSPPRRHRAAGSRSCSSSPREALSPPRRSRRRAPRPPAAHWCRHVSK